MSEKRWPKVGQVILVQDVPTTDAQRELWANRQPPTRKGEVVMVPDGGGRSEGFLVIDVGGEYGGVTYAARDFPGRYTWKLAGTEGLTRKQADATLQELREAVEQARLLLGDPNTQVFITAFEKLDASLSAGFEHPSDWK